MTEFTKTKMQFALAMLATLFALHKILDSMENIGFNYLGVELKVHYLYALVSGLLALTVYCYAVGLLSVKPASRSERVGNYLYALAILVIPLYGLLYVSSIVADQVGEEHLKVTAPTVALSLGILWLVISQVMAFHLRGRLGDQDKKAKLEQLVEQEITSVNRAPELQESHYHDLAVIEMWRAIELRLRRVLLMRGYAEHRNGMQTLIDMAVRAGIINEPVRKLIDEVRAEYKMAVSHEPLPRESAEKALQTARVVLASVAVESRAA